MNQPIILTKPITDQIKKPINLWRVEDPAGLEALFADPEFEKVKELRNRLHNFDELTLFMGQPG